jgi:hypothetical protein
MGQVFIPIKTDNFVEFNKNYQFGSNRFSIDIDTVNASLTVGNNNHAAIIGYRFFTNKAFLQAYAFFGDNYELSYTGLKGDNGTLSLNNSVVGSTPTPASYSNQINVNGKNVLLYP